MDNIELLFIELTTSCNLNCIHCGYYLESTNYIDCNDVIYSINSCLPYGLKKIMLTGGEPTLHPAFEQILIYSKNIGLCTKVTSNGNNIHKTLSLLENGLIDELVFSIDAFTEPTYKIIRGKCGLENIWTELIHCCHTKNKISLSFLIQKNNYMELLPFLKKCLQENIQTIVLLVPHCDGDFTHSLPAEQYYKNVFFDHDDVDRFNNCVKNELISFFLEHMDKFKISEDHLYKIIDNLLNPMNVYATRKEICSLPLHSIFVYSDKSVSMCPYQNRWKFANLDCFLSGIANNRFRAIFEGSAVHSICKCCLEVPL